MLSRLLVLGVLAAAVTGVAVGSVLREAQGLPGVRGPAAVTSAALESLPVVAQKKKGVPGISFPPRLPQDQTVVVDTSEEFLQPPPGLAKEVRIARTPPTVEFLYFPGQIYEGKPWSNWGDSLCAQGKYFASIGDHLAPQGNAFVYEYDPQKRHFRLLVDVRQLLKLPEGHYTPGKIHSRLDLGSDGWLYFSTHRGSTQVTNDTYHYKGDWILRVHPGTGQAEVVVQGPVPKHCIPCSVLDPKRMIFYGGTVAGAAQQEKDIRFFAYDVRQRKRIYSGPHGPSRAMIWASSTGRVYYNPDGDPQTVVRWDPDKGTAPEKIAAAFGIRAATQETPQGYVYAVSPGQKGQAAQLYAFDTRTEQVEALGSAAVASQQYITSLDADPTGRYLYYIPGAHGSSDADGTPIVQFDTRTRQKKVIAFLHPFYQRKYGVSLRGTYSSAIDEKGEKLYITWNASRGSRAWDCCALTVVHIPPSERP